MDQYSLEYSLKISESGLRAARVYNEIIASNLANLQTTHTLEGGPYRRKTPILSERNFSNELARAENRLGLGGVDVLGVVEDETPGKRIYNPSHPDADKEGFVELPNVSMSTEMVDLIFAQRWYEANITVFNSTKQMMSNTLELSR